MNMIAAKNSWKQPRYRKECFSVCALVPVYLPDGTNGSRIYYMDGGMEQSTAQFSWVLNDLLAYQRSSKSLLRQQSRRLLEQLGQPQQKRLPLLLTPDFALMPVKARQPWNHNHAVDGYVVYALVEGMVANDHGPGMKIFLRNRQELLVLDSVRTLRENLQMMKQLVEAMEEVMDALS